MNWFHPFEFVGGVMLQGTLRATVLILCVLLLRSVGRRFLPAQVWWGLWIIVALKLLLPVTPGASWSAFNLGPWLVKPAAEETAPEWKVNLATEDSPAMPETQPPVNSPEPEIVTAKPIDTWQWVVTVWLAGVVGQLVVLGWSSTRWRRELKLSTDNGESRLTEMLRECQVTLGLRRTIILRETCAVRSPAVTGIFRPQLLLPSGLAPQLSDGELRFVLLHELAHVRRGDLILLWLLTFARIIHWFNPLAWIAERVAKADLELACDETVLRRIEAVDPAGYGAALLKLAQRCTRQPTPVPMAGIVNSRRSLKSRLQRIVSYRPASLWRSGLAAALVCSVALAFGANEKSPEPAAISKEAIDKMLFAPSWQTVQAPVQNPVSEAAPVITAGPSFGEGWVVISLSFYQQGSKMHSFARVRKPDGQEFSFLAGANCEGVMLSGIDWTDLRRPKVLLARGQETASISLLPDRAGGTPPPSPFDGWKVTGISIPAPSDEGAAQVTVESSQGVTMTFIDLEKNESGVWAKIEGLMTEDSPLEVQLYRGDEPVAKLSADRGFVSTRKATSAFGRQVFIESKFIEISESALKKIGSAGLGGGFDLGSLFTGHGVPSLVGVFTEPQAVGLVAALQKTKGVDLLSAPRVTTRSGQRATVEIIREFRYPVAFEPDPKNPGGFTPTDFETKNVGVTLDVLPKVGEGGTIDLDVSPQITEFLGFVDAKTRQPIKAGKAKPPQPDAPTAGPLFRSNEAMSRYSDSGAFQKGVMSQPIFSEQKITTTVTIFPNSTILLTSRRNLEQVSKFAKETPGRFTLILISARFVEPEPAPK